jgi:2'-5' RNA ligase
VTEESALLITVPAAERAVARHRSRLDPNAADGVPAHTTVLYPFLPPGEIGADAHAELARLFASVPAFRFTLDRIGWFPNSPVLWLGPSDPAPFSALTDLVAAAFPSCPPYGGQFAAVIPHLTIGEGAALADLRVAAAAVRPHLPIAAEATEVTLMTGPPPRSAPPGGRWTTVAAFPLVSLRGVPRGARAAKRLHPWLAGP